MKAASPAHEFLPMCEGEARITDLCNTIVSGRPSKIDQMRPLLHEGTSPRRAITEGAPSR